MAEPLGLQDSKREEPSTSELISKTCDHFKKFLLAKNRKYGDSALSPRKIFNKEGSTTALTVRIDDKLNRIINSDTIRKNDTVDLVGYLILFCIDKGWTSFEDQID